jgi:hypothetical protein
MDQSPIVRARADRATPPVDSSRPRAAGQPTTTPIRSRLPTPLSPLRRAPAPTDVETRLSLRHVRAARRCAVVCVEGSSNRLLSAALLLVHRETPPPMRPGGRFAPHHHRAPPSTRGHVRFFRWLEGTWKTGTAAAEWAAAAVRVGCSVRPRWEAGSAVGRSGSSRWIRGSARVATCAAGQADAAQRRRSSSRRRPRRARPWGPAASQDDCPGTPAARFAASGGCCRPRAS